MVRVPTVHLNGTNGVELFDQVTFALLAVGDAIDKLRDLYSKAKRDQWNSTDRLDWSIDVDPEKGLVPDAGIGIYGTPMWDKLTQKEIRQLRHEAITWQLCQFLHGFDSYLR